MYRNFTRRRRPLRSCKSSVRAVRWRVLAGLKEQNNTIRCVVWPPSIPKENIRKPRLSTRHIPGSLMAGSWEVKAKRPRGPVSREGSSEGEP